MDTPSTTSKPLHCVVVTPEKAVLDEVCDFVAVPMYDGELGVLSGRMPLIGRLGCGELRTQSGNRIHRYFIDGGFVQIKNNIVTVLTSKALKAEEIDVTAAEQALKAAQQPAPDPAIQEAQRKAQDRARAQIRVAKHNEKPGLSLEGIDSR
jgi:F-type H+-transporting ATPase subunit epsilon